MFCDVLQTHGDVAVLDGGFVLQLHTAVKGRVLVFVLSAVVFVEEDVAVYLQVRSGPLYGLDVCTSGALASQDSITPRCHLHLFWTRTENKIQTRSSFHLKRTYQNL